MDRKYFFYTDSRDVDLFVVAPHFAQKTSLNVRVKSILWPVSFARFFVDLMAAGILG
jgi:hypothetical protein